MLILMLMNILLAIIIALLIAYIIINDRKHNKKVDELEAKLKLKIDEIAYLDNEITKLSGDRIITNFKK